MKRVITFFTAVLILTVSTVFGQTGPVNGTVVDAQGEAVIGATVRVEGSPEGAITGVDGSFIINASPGDNLIISFVGLETQTVVVGADTSLGQITMVQGANLLDQVIVTGYDTRTSDEFTGAASVIRADEIGGLPEGSLDQALVGKSAGLLVVGGSGQPGANAQVRVRGATAPPLYIIDGVPVETADFRSVNTNDIESISVLKDAAASGLYGARAANGVVSITTKKGSGKPTVFFNTQYGSAIAPGKDDFLPLLSTDQKIDLELEQGVNSATLTPAQIDELRKYETDWVDVLLDNGIYQQYALGTTGSSGKVNYYLNGQFLDQDGVIIGSELKRYSGRANLEISEKLYDIGLNLTGAYSEQVGTREGDAFIGSPLNAIYWSNPYETPYFSDGSYNANSGGRLAIVQDLFGANAWGTQPNGLLELLENTRTNPQIKLLGDINGTFRVPWVDGLSVSARIGMDFRDNRPERFLDPQTYSGVQANGQQGSLQLSTNHRREYEIFNKISYERSFGDDHNMNVNLYHEFINQRFDNFNVTAFGFGGSKFENLTGATTNNPAFIPNFGGGDTEFALDSYFASAYYNFREKYFFDGYVRRDAASKLAPTNRVVWYAGAGAGWIISEEDFMADKEWVRFLKLRASYGSVADLGALGNFPFLENYTTNSYNGQNGLVLGGLGNSELIWPLKNKLNIGIDAEFFNSRLSTTVEVYNDRTEDLLFTRPVSRTTGFRNINANTGSIRDRGIDVNLTGDVLQNADLELELFANFNYNKNKYIELPDDNADISTTTTLQRVGEAVGTNYVVPYVGVNAANGDALYLTEDGQVTNVFSQADQRVYGTRIPPYKGGFGFNADYKGIFANTLFSWTAGNKIYNNERTNIDNPTYISDQLSTEFLRMWRKPGDITDVPRYDNPYQTATSRYIEDGSYLRFKNLKVGYDLPKSLLKNVFKSVSIYGQGNNIFTWTDFTGFDPDVYNGIAFGAYYPSYETFNIGIDVKF